MHPRIGHSLRAEATDARPMGWGSLTWDGLGTDAVLLAADAWKDRGLVTALLHALAEAAEDIGCQVLRLYAAHGDDAARPGDHRPRPAVHRRARRYRSDRLRHTPHLSSIRRARP
ncbi:hypothetical protein [Streptomyces sp. NBC_01320]|uniref:hypothetical protein n=1 Tax=Streptomyces sp. NBC_01320 TaxID=2903824 RepID=UPI002E151A48|nr:hypothetical protein OG395_07670 [Streptomyces sp. NBC_01320]